MRDDKLCPVEVMFLNKDQVANELLSLPENRVVTLICTEGIAKCLDYEKVIMDMSKRYHLTWIDQAIANPTQVDVMESVKKIGSMKPDIIYAIGGGSSIDTAKGISAFYDLIQTGASIEELTRSIKDKSYQNNTSFIPIVAIPTTAGTGSEVTKWATIWDYQHTAKYSIDTDHLYPQKAIISTDLTLTLPKRLVLSTALDAMSHAIEAFWSKQTSPVVQDIAFLAVSKIHQYLPIALIDLANIEAREELCRASLLAGIAFSNTRTTACHSISYPITMGYGVEHGLAVAMLLAPVSKINVKAMPKVHRLLDLFKEDGGIGDWIEEVSTGICKLHLSEFGIQKDDIDTIVEKSFTQGRMDNNPVDITPEQVKEMLLEIL